MGPVTTINEIGAGIRLMVKQGAKSYGKSWAERDSFKKRAKEFWTGIERIEYE